MRDRTRIVVRQLPPKLKKEKFFELLTPYNNDIENSIYCSGCHKTSGDIASRAYIKFTTDHAVSNFIAHFDKHSFYDKNGVSVPCQIEYAPLQFTNLNISEGDSYINDPLFNTMENDADYLSFLKNLNENEEKESENQNNQDTQVISLLETIEKKALIKIKSKKKKNNNTFHPPKKSSNKSQNKNKVYKVAATSEPQQNTAKNQRTPYKVKHPVSKPKKAKAKYKKNQQS